MACFWTQLQNTSCIEVVAAGNQNFKGAGLNDQGQLGLGHNNPVNVFTPLPLDNVVKISMGYKFAMAIDTAGILYGTGLNDRNQLTSALPASVNTWTPISSGFLDINCGFGCAMGIKTNGDVMRVGQGIENLTSSSASIVKFNNPVFTNINGFEIYTSTRSPSSFTLPLGAGESIKLGNKADYPLAVLKSSGGGGGGPGGPGPGGPGPGGPGPGGPGNALGGGAPKTGFRTQGRDGSVLSDDSFYASVHLVDPGVVGQFFSNTRYITGSSSGVIYDHTKIDYRGDGVPIYGSFGTAPHVFTEDKLYCGDDGVFIIDASDNLYAMGSNLKGELGLTGTNISTMLLVGSNFVKVEPAPFITFALKTNGKWYASGRNVHGNMGLGHYASSNSFIEIGTFSDVSVHNSDTLVMV